MRNLNSPSLTLSRDALRDGMTSAGWPPSLIADAELAMVELIVNAWRHGETTSPVILIHHRANTSCCCAPTRPETRASTSCWT
ncbi:hypothetical protein ACIQOV_32165, partial [Kitasatospora sp. NPDC091257]|uniref:hypothetical protein n=1 Tax=Kitasatospora sp. NPDC091257 TaxID=3364084 RepID=UPI00380ED339